MLKDDYEEVVIKEARIRERTAAADEKSEGVHIEVSFETEKAIYTSQYKLDYVLSDEGWVLENAAPHEENAWICTPLAGMSEADVLAYLPDGAEILSNTVSDTQIIAFKYTESNEKGTVTYTAEQTFAFNPKDESWYAAADPLIISEEIENHLKSVLLENAWYTDWEGEAAVFFFPDGTGFMISGVLWAPPVFLDYQTTESHVEFSSGDYSATWEWYPSHGIFADSSRGDAPYSPYTHRDMFQFFADYLDTHNPGDPDNFPHWEDLMDTLLIYFECVYDESEYDLLLAEQQQWEETKSQLLRDAGIDTSVGDGRYIIRMLNRDYTKERVLELIQRI